MDTDIRRLVPAVIKRRYALKFAIVAVIGLSVAIIGGIATVAVANGVEESVQEEYRFAASQEADRISKWIEQNERTVRLASDGETLTGDSDADRQAYLDRQSELADSQQPDAFLLVDRESADIVSQSRTDLGSLTAGTNLREDGDAVWLSELSLKGPDDTYTSTVFESYDSQPMIAFVSPVTGDQDLMVVWLVERPGPEFLRGSQMDAKGSYHALGGWLVGANPHGENVASTLEVLRAFHSREVQLTALDTLGYLPHDPSLFSGEAYDDRVYGEYMDTLAFAGEHTVARPVSQAWPEQEAAIVDEVHTALEGDKLPGRAMRDLETRLG
ncbi:hypothetical protein ACFQJ7_01855 [Halovenus rubra]|uniref:Uncharacterized protein n=2 Tax=Halovenus rubra TaxID=869890 RepID=A0ACC7E326_9EURY|nr:hypothetical protein [Halovenus rubra]